MSARRRAVGGDALCAAYSGTKGITWPTTSDLPGAPRSNGTALAAGGDARDRDVIAADHEVDVDLAAVHARARSASLDGELEALPEGDVAGGVLVEQGVEEDGVERADRGPRDRRARPRRGVPPPSSRRGQRAEGLGALVGVDLDGAAALEADLAGP